MGRRTKIELFKEAMKFSAAHFTIFSATHRENLHGHNFTVQAELEGAVSDNGMTFDYAECRRKLIEACMKLNEVTLLPGKSPHLTVKEDGGHVIALFHDEQLTFLRRDVLVLPVRNVTCEELSAYLLDGIVRDTSYLSEHDVRHITVKVLSGPGQSASAEWIA